jgi:hypothetical protein
MIKNLIKSVAISSIVSSMLLIANQVALAAAKCTVMGKEVPCEETGKGLLVFVIAFLGLIIASITISIAFYIYGALAIMAIAKKTNTKPAWLAWIPIANIYLLSKMAGMHWWPILLLIPFMIPIVNVITGIILAIFVAIWYWKIFERVGKPGWWAIMLIIPIVGTIIFLVLLGIAAWGKSGRPSSSPSIPPSYPATPESPK